MQLSQACQNKLREWSNWTPRIMKLKISIEVSENCIPRQAFKFWLFHTRFPQSHLRMFHYDNMVVLSVHQYRVKKLNNRTCLSYKTKLSNFIVDSRFVYPIIDRFSLQLISPVSWEIIPGTRLVRNEDLFPFSVFFCFLFLVFSCIIIDLVKCFQFHMNLISRPQT